MISFRPPSELERTAFRLKQSRQGFTYSPIGCTLAEKCPAGFKEDRARIHLGFGREIFDRACEAIRDWVQFPQKWTSIEPDHAKIAEGTTISLVAKTYGIYTMNACRIVSVIQDENRFGFSYGTLPGHMESGEERFLIEHGTDDGVYYEILAYSRPRHWLARLCYPLARLAQARFRKDSCNAMKNAISKSCVAV